MLVEEDVVGAGHLLVVDNGTHYLSELERALKLLDVPYRLQAAAADMPSDGLDDVVGVILTGGQVHIYEPSAAAHVSLSLRLVQQVTVPLLGLCLGCQLIAWHHGARVERLPEPIDQPTSIHILVDDALFAGVPSPAVMVMAHNDAIVDLGPTCVALARSQSGEFEAIRHRHRPLYGLQFHPEASGEPGRRLLANFASLCDWGVDAIAV